MTDLIPTCLTWPIEGSFMDPELLCKAIHKCNTLDYCPPINCTDGG